jgi:hypothetical protein
MSDAFDHLLVLLLKPRLMEAVTNGKREGRGRTRPALIPFKTQVKHAVASNFTGSCH